MKIPVEKSVYRQVYLQLKTGFLSERPAFYDAVRIVRPPMFIRNSDKLPNLLGIKDRLMKKFTKKYPYHFEDFVSDNSESTRYVAYNFANKQYKLMLKGIPENVAFCKVEKEFLNELNVINCHLVDYTREYPVDIGTESVDEVGDAEKGQNGAEECRDEAEDGEEEGLEENRTGENRLVPVSLETESQLRINLINELHLKQREKIYNVVDRTINSYKEKYGDHVIAEKLKALKNYRLDSAHPAEPYIPRETPVDDDFDMSSMIYDDDVGEPDTAMKEELEPEP